MYMFVTFMEDPHSLEQWLKNRWNTAQYLK